MTVADYVMKLADLKKSQIKFVILDGSAAIGEDRKYSDYGVMNVGRKKRNLASLEIFLESSIVGLSHVGFSTQRLSRASGSAAMIKALFGEPNKFVRQQGRIC